jgi:hypothetical protein
VSPLTAADRLFGDGDKQERVVCHTPQFNDKVI